MRTMFEVLFFLFLALQVADYVTTIHALDKGHSEANPVLSALFKRFGPKRTLVVAKLLIIVSFSVALLLGFLSIAALSIATGFYAVVIINNLRVLNKE